MKIEPQLLRRHLHQAALEQLAASLSREGYVVERDALSLHGSRFDLLARRGEETLVFEVRVVGEAAAAPDRRLRALSDAARAVGGRFRLVVLRPDRQVEVEVDGIERALQRRLAADPPADLRHFGNGVGVTEVTGVEIDRLHVEAGSRMRVAGHAVATVALPATEGAASPPVLFGFDLVLDPAGAVASDPPPRFVFDLADGL